MRYALPNKRLYPIETAEQVKTAAAYFDKYLDKFHPAERVAIADGMEKRASELGMFMDSPWIYNYSRKGSVYSPDFDLHMKMRKEACMGKKIEHNGKTIKAEELFDKVASLKRNVKPKEMVDLLYDFDKKANITADYDRKIRDPFFTVYGSSNCPLYDHQKLASDVYVRQLESAVLNEGFISKMAEAYGDDFVNGFKQDPVNVYQSMPVPDKQNILNIVRDSRDDG